MNIKVVNSINKIPIIEWNSLVSAEFPFASYAFLNALEVSGSVGQRTGWAPCYLTVRRNEELVGALILYSKTNSYGEYIFDFAWAQAYASYGMDYYPKLLSAIPFTPATGPKVLVHAKAEAPGQIRKALIEAAIDLMSSQQMSSLHFNFIEESEIKSFKAAEMFIRHSFQYHWENNDYQSFEDFLARLKSKRRKEITRERNQVAKSHISIQRLTGDELTNKHAEIMHAFYVNTVNKMGGFPYLTQAFFSEVFKHMKNNILLVLATDSSSAEPVAGAINFIGSETLFGRHWGSTDDSKFLHFELCYYQAIEFAIEQKLRLFEAGAQGEHKFQRGFMPCLTYSAHKILDPRMSDAIERFVSEEKKGIAEVFSEYAEHTPFAQSRD